MWSETLLSQTEGQWYDVISDADDDDEDEAKLDGEDWVDDELPRRVTVREVLKYSLTWVIIP